jgi:PAS domain S-box-containing protein
VRSFTLLNPILAAYVLLGIFQFFQASELELLIGLLTFVFGSSMMIFKNKEFLIIHAYTVHLLYIALLKIFAVIWVITIPDAHSTFGYFLLTFIGGLIVIKPLYTAFYFAASATTVILLSFLIDHPYIDIRFAFYIVSAGILVTIFAYWRHQLTHKNKETSDTYKNLFSDLSEQIFVLDQNMKILETNKSAQDYLKEKFGETLVGKNFSEVFCSDNDNDMLRFQDAVAFAWKGNKRKIELTCGLKGENQFIPKEFSLRKSVFFGQDVLILVIRSIQDQKEFEQRLIDSKENISRVLDNISSFIYNITYNANGDHQVNYVSNKVSDVFGIETDEYITLVKSGRLSEIFYHADRAEATLRFEEVLKTCQSNRIRFRIVRRGEIRWVEEKIFPKKIAPTGMIQLFGIITDITEQTEALEALETSEKRYRQMFEKNLAGVYKTHVDGTILDANLAFAKILGFDSVEELKKRNIKDFYCEQDDRKDYLDKLRKEGFINNHISYLYRKDGKKIVLNNNVSIQPDEDGNLNIIEGTLIDITEIEETSNALKLSEEKYRLLFEESKEGIFVISLGRESAPVVDLNQGAADLLGYSKEEIFGKDFETYIVKGANLKAQIASEQNTKKIETEWTFRQKNGGEFVAEISVVSFLLGNDRIVQLVFKDISERKKNEEILRESQRSFKNIVDNSPAAILIFTDKKLVYTNSLGTAIYQERLNHQTDNLFEIFPAEQKYILEELLSQDKPSDLAFTEIELHGKTDVRKYSLNTVKTVYKNQKSDLILLQDVTLQTEYNRQKVRAEVAEDTNKKLQDEIARHKETQAQLMEKTFWLNALFESSYNLFILSLDEHYRVVSFNENFRKMIQETLGKEVKSGDVFLDMFNTTNEARKNIELRFDRVLKGETLEMISHYESKRGEIWVESFLNPVKIGDRKISEISFISHEITDKIEAQKKIKNSEANNRAILFALPDMLTKINRKGVFTDFRMNLPSTLDHLMPHLKTNEFIGKSLFDVFKDPHLAERFHENIIKSLENNELLTDTIELKSIDNNRSFYYENRFSKMSEDEVIVLSRNVTETMEYETMLVESVKEKEILLKEVHHRVKNNLQVINSILNLQSSYVEDPKTLEIINESQNRIRSMSYIHESLYQTKDFSSIDFADYLTNLVQNLVHSYQLYQDKIDLKMNVGSVKLALDQAIPCGLILNELVSNALKYAYPGNKKGSIVIDVIEKDKRISIGVTDFGVGLPEGFDIEKSESLGLSLVYTLVDQLDGELTLNRLGGTKFLINFDKQEV